MLDRFLEEVVVSVVGKIGEELSKIINSKKHVNEFNIASKLDVTINQTRNYLYRLSDFGIVSSIRKKDKKKGWYIYFWRIEILKTLEFLLGKLEAKKEEIGNTIKKLEESEHYICDRCDLEFDEETALLMNFTCEECEGIFIVKDNSKTLKELKRIYGDLEKKIVLVSEEVEKENARLNKIREREMKKLEKEKEEKKLEKKLARQKLAEKKKKEKEKEKAKAGVIKKTASKKKVIKKVAVKKTATKKTVSKKSEDKKTVVKKAVLKKSVVKKAVLKKVSKKK